MKSITTYPLTEIKKILQELGQPSFRAQQLIDWIYKKGVTSYDAMTNLPQSLRDALSTQYPFNPPKIIDKQISYDGTRKYVLEFSDGVRVETVGMPSLQTDSKGKSKHLSVCFSTQAGCPMQCAFCATGTEGLTRNLSAGEMILQIIAVQNDFHERVSHVVAMGQGEPFLNYDAMLEALRFINAKKGLEIGARHITVSTCGVIPGIERFAQETEQFTLAISLHSAEQQIRNELMPQCARWPLSDLKSALLSYVDQTNRRVSLEYLMIKNLNDTSIALESLIDFSEGLLCHINLIPFNPVDHCSYKPSDEKTLTRFQKELHHFDIETTIRNSRGSDVAGACGQLKNKMQR